MPHLTWLNCEERKMVVTTLITAVIMELTSDDEYDRRDAKRLRRDNGVHFEEDSVIDEPLELLVAAFAMMMTPFRSLQLPEQRLRVRFRESWGGVESALIG